MQRPSFFGHRKSINLLPRDEFENSTIGTVLSWALVFGKWSVIITQLIVMGTFLWRFSLDRASTDLRKEIAKEVAVIKSYEQIERDFSLAQKQITQISATTKEQQKLLDGIEEIEKMMPTGVWLEKMTVNPTEISLTAYAADLPGFGTFISRVQQNTNFSQVRVGKIASSSRGSQIQFEVNLSMGAKK